MTLHMSKKSQELLQMSHSVLSTLASLGFEHLTFTLDCVHSPCGSLLDVCLGSTSFGHWSAPFQALLAPDPEALSSLGLIPWTFISPNQILYFLLFLQKTPLQLLALCGQCYKAEICNKIYNTDHTQKGSSYNKKGVKVLNCFKIEKRTY